MIFLEDFFVIEILFLIEKEFIIRAKCFVNATGAYTDSIRQLDDPSMSKICQPSAGVHIVLPDYYSPNKYGSCSIQIHQMDVLYFFYLGKNIQWLVCLSNILIDLLFCIVVVIFESFMN